MKTATATSTNDNPVDVILTVTRFYDLLSRKSSRDGVVTPHTMKLARRDARVRLEGDKLYVAPPGAAIRFAVVGGSGDRQRYYPLGIAFVRKGASKSDEQRLGFLNFPQRETRAEGRTLTIVDTYRDRLDVRYKFSIYIQRAADGAIGIIDPEIIHTGDA